MENVQNVVSNVTNSASKMIWGEGNTEQSQEPVSGEQGPGTKTEPFDQGNKQDEAPTTTESTETSTEPTGQSGTTEPDTSTGGETATSTAAVGDSGASDPSTGTHVAESQVPEQKQQGADKPEDEPIGEQKDAVKESKDEGEAAMAKRDPNDHSGEPLKVHDDSEKKESSEGAGEGASEGASGQEGTGEKYVKSTGLAAEGGDFDAANPGAGREADRLLEEKGVDRSGGNQGPPQQDTSGGGDDDKAKPKTLDKIKEKLHIGKH